MYFVYFVNLYILYIFSILVQSIKLFKKSMNVYRTSGRSPLRVFRLGAAPKPLGQLRRRSAGATVGATAVRQRFMSRGPCAHGAASAQRLAATPAHFTKFVSWRMPVSFWRIPVSFRKFRNNCVATTYIHILLCIYIYICIYVIFSICTLYIYTKLIKIYKIYK